MPAEGHGMSGQSNFMQKDKRTINHSNQPSPLYGTSSFSVWILVTVDDFPGNVTFVIFRTRNLEGSFFFFFWRSVFRECLHRQQKAKKCFPGKSTLCMRGKLWEFYELPANHAGVSCCSNKVFSSLGLKWGVDLVYTSQRKLSQVGTGGSYDCRCGAVWLYGAIIHIWYTGNKCWVLFAGKCSIPELRPKTLSLQITQIISTEKLIFITHSLG